MTDYNSPAPDPAGQGGGEAPSPFGLAAENAENLAHAFTGLIGNYFAGLRDGATDVPPDHPAAILSGAIAVAFVRAMQGHAIIADGKLTVEFPAADPLVDMLPFRDVLPMLWKLLIDWVDDQGGRVLVLSVLHQDGAAIRVATASRDDETMIRRARPDAKRSSSSAAVRHQEVLKIAGRRDRVDDPFGDVVESDDAPKATR